MAELRTLRKLRGCLIASLGTFKDYHRNVIAGECKWKLEGNRRIGPLHSFCLLSVLVAILFGPIATVVKWGPNRCFILIGFGTVTMVTFLRRLLLVFLL